MPLNLVHKRSSGRIETLSCLNGLCFLSMLFPRNSNFLLTIPSIKDKLTTFRFYFFNL